MLKVTANDRQLTMLRVAHQICNICLQIVLVIDTLSFVHQAHLSYEHLGVNKGCRFNTSLQNVRYQVLHGKAKSSSIVIPTLTLHAIDSGGF